MTRTATSVKRALGRWLALALLLAPRAAVAWTFPEHQRISETALKTLVEDSITKQRWAEFRASIDPKLSLCADGDDKAKNDPKKPCIPVSSLPALAGDHACTPYYLEQQLRGKHDWIFDVLEVADATQRDLDEAGTDVADREAARRAMHIDLQAADSDYVPRAILDFSHFQLAREAPGTDLAGLRAYLKVALDPKAQANATASYVNYHVAALRLAAAARREPANKLAYLTRALLAEAFAAHFLEDSFSTGHFVGHWGDVATRLGTHDFYSGAGFQASRWSKPGVTYVAHGDAFLSDNERETVASAVTASLWQIVEAATDDADASRLVSKFSRGFSEETYDSCRRETVAPGLIAFADIDTIADVVREEPVPATRHPEVPRMRAEQGPFFGAGATVSTGYVGVEEALNTRVMASGRIGYGAAGIVNDPLNAQAFLESGFIGARLYDGSGTSLTGFYFRARGPGLVVFVDGWFGILASVIDNDCAWCVGWAAAAAGGGLGRIWRGHHIAGNLSWQISALRDGTISFFPNQPKGSHRIDVLAPVLTFRHFWPGSGGSSWSQSTDVYLDLGPSATWVDGNTARFGGYASLSIAPRVFP